MYLSFDSFSDRYLFNLYILVCSLYNLSGSGNTGNPDIDRTDRVTWHRQSKYGQPQFYLPSFSIIKVILITHKVLILKLDHNAVEYLERTPVITRSIDNKALMFCLLNLLEFISQIK